MQQLLVGGASAQLALLFVGLFALPQELVYDLTSCGAHLVVKRF